MSALLRGAPAYPIAAHLWGTVLAWQPPAGPWCVTQAVLTPALFPRSGMCVPSEQGHFLPGEMEETIIESFSPDHGIPDLHPKRTTSPSQLHHLKGKGAWWLFH